MKYTDTELEKILDRLAVSTRSPRGRYTAATGYPKLRRQMQPLLLRLVSTRAAIAAAAVILLCLTAWSIYLYRQETDTETLSTLAAVRSISLPDGSTVTLNRYSSISYPKRFGRSLRQVQLKGGAYFEVSKDRRCPFMVQTETVNVQVLGTRFNIDAYEADQEVRTTLLSGSVAVSSKDGTTRLVLQPHETAIYNKVQQTLLRQRDTDTELAWIQGELVFEQLPLQEIARRLSNAFNTPIHIADSTLQNFRISARFRHSEGLHSILSILQEAGYLNFTYTNKHITLTPKTDFQ